MPALPIIRCPQCAYEGKPANTPPLFSVLALVLLPLAAVLLFAAAGDWHIKGLVDTNTGMWTKGALMLGWVCLIWWPIALLTSLVWPNIECPDCGRDHLVPLRSVPIKEPAGDQ